MAALSLLGIKMLWDLVYKTLRPKGNETPNQCLNRLTNERLDNSSKVNLSESTANIEEQIWRLDQLALLDSKHTRMHDFDDFRPLVIVNIEERYILVDGNHRVSRATSLNQDREFPVLIVKPTVAAYKR